MQLSSLFSANRNLLALLTPYNMKHIFSSVLSIALLTVSCDRHECYYNVDSHIITTSNIEAQQSLNLEPISISIIGALQICCADSLLFVTTENPNSQLVIINTNNSEIIAEMCPKGRGPNEYLMFYTLKQFDRNKEGDLLLYTFDNRTLNVLNITESLKNKYAVIDRKYKTVINKCQTIILDSDDFFMKQEVSYEDARDNIFFPPKYVLKQSGKEKDVNIYPDVIVNENYKELPIFIYSGILRIRPDKNKAVDIMATMDYMNIIDIMNEKTLGVWDEGAYFFEQLCTMSKANLLDIVKYCTTDAIVTNNYIIILYDGRTANQVNNKLTACKPSIKIYNWDGRFIDEFHITEAISQIAYDEKKNILYMLDQTENLYKCTLDNLNIH